MRGGAVVNTGMRSNSIVATISNMVLCRKHISSGKSSRSLQGVGRCGNSILRGMVFEGNKGGPLGYLKAGGGAVVITGMDLQSAAATIFRMCPYNI